MAYASPLSSRRVDRRMKVCREVKCQMIPEKLDIENSKLIFQHGKKIAYLCVCITCILMQKGARVGSNSCNSTGQGFQRNIQPDTYPILHVSPDKPNTRHPQSHKWHMQSSRGKNSDRGSQTAQKRITICFYLLCSHLPVDGPGNCTSTSRNNQSMHQRHLSQYLSL